MKVDYLWICVMKRIACNYVVDSIEGKKKAERVDGGRAKSLRN